MKLEDYLDEEFKLLGVTVRGTIATPEHKRSFPTVVTIVTTFKLNDATVEAALIDCEIGYWKYKRYRIQSLESYVKQTLETMFQPSGIAVCDHRDQFDPELGSIIAKGRLLKALRARRFMAAQVFDGSDADPQLQMDRYRRAERFG